MVKVWMKKILTRQKSSFYSSAQRLTAFLNIDGSIFSLLRSILHWISTTERSRYLADVCGGHVCSTSVVSNYWSLRQCARCYLPACSLKAKNKSGILTRFCFLFQRVKSNFYVWWYNIYFVNAFWRCLEFQLNVFDMLCTQSSLRRPGGITFANG